MNIERIGTLFTTLPPLEEQRAIANFLDSEMAKLDTLIAKKQRLIELLKEKRAALINRVVVSGLSHTRQPVFDEEIRQTPWLYPLSNGWKREKLKYNSYLKGRLGWQNLRSDEYTDEGPYLVSSEHFKDNKIEWHRCKHVSHERYEMAPEIILQKHDVLFMKDGAAMGKLAYVDELPGEACLNSHLLLMRPLKHSYLPRFLFYVLKTSVFESYMVQERAGATFFGFSQQSMGNYPISLPPVSIQQKIVDYLDEETARIDALIAKTEETIEKLQEYRTALISAAVTGKIDVRGS